MSTRIWFNRTFSAASHYIEMIRNNEDREKFIIYATHPRQHSPMLQVADYSEIEPILPMDEYIAYCLDFCKKHQIDVFIPHFGLTEISYHGSAFQQIGTQVLIGGDPTLLEVVGDKGRLFQALSSVEGLTLPDYFIATTVNEFQQAYRTLKEKGHRICIKPVKGEGGGGFRIIEETPADIWSIYEPVTNTLLLEDLIELLSSVDHFDALMVMELLEGHEYSVDCLGRENELLAAVPRKKVEGRIRKLEANAELIELSRAIQKVLSLQYNFNVQFIYQHNVPKLLEINPRASGGLYMSCLSGVNFPYLALKSLLGGEVHVQEPKLDITATHIEKELIISNA
ncbi:biotin carboxylase [Paenibacillus shirakamiensis]|uniref:Biotin carboxylase n=1 Tax=Paenibacillus shirakamiensis TaxID=1265935 RepID=A0ABS4JGJ0_9BACL|nr:ATP-grasp domain-containing protein [Paenibacillus shirakamiensis]MBP2000838.1 biotin carboxylase [Paenibacillus shirakamiensis]